MSLTRRQLFCGIFAAFSKDPLQAASEILDRATSHGWFNSPDINAVVLDVCYGKQRYTKAYGVAGTAQRVFVIASITKVLVAMAAMALQDHGELALGDRVVRFVPTFRGERRDEVTIQNLLTHTSGLPESVPQIQQMFKHQATLDEIFTATCQTPLLFAPGEAFSYSNLGVLVLREVMYKITGVPLPELLKTMVFGPLLMNDTSLGLGGRPLESTAQNQHDADQPDPNTLYHRELATPWGGIHSTGADLTRCLRYFMHPEDGPLKSATAKEMLLNHCEGLNQPWGLGWMLSNSHDTHYRVAPTRHRYGWASLFSNPERLPAFGLGCSTSSFGHYGVSGTLAWADPQRDISMVLLTTKPVRYSRDGVLGPVSDLLLRL
jgi:CubicO group peptidase (beta-lactamase class C family)